MDFKEFLVLSNLVEGDFSQRKLSQKTKLSLGTINKIIKNLNDSGLPIDNKISEKGMNLLDEHKAKRAIFIAAGFGSRLVPITLNTPKPLVRVHGVRIIDTLIDACLKADINEIYIVRGYLGEQFDSLLTKYPMIKFIENPLFNEANNISSILMAKNLLENAYVFEADLFLSNPEIISKYHYCSDVLGIYMDRTDDWCLTTDKRGYVINEQVGGLNCHQMVGIYYLNKEDGIRLSKDVVDAFSMPGGKERYWEQVPNVVFKGKYKIFVRDCNKEDIVEIDTFKELQEIDKSYKC